MTVFVKLISYYSPADFVESVKTISDYTFAIVDGYYICKSIGAAAWRLSKGLKGAGNPFKLPSAKGLIGKNFEEFLAKNLPEGEVGFMKGGRDFDSAYGNPKKWVEAKSGGYWTNQTSSESGLAKFKSDMGDRLRIAKENGVEYELFSNTAIPDNIKTWLDGKGIKYYEILK